MNEESVALEIWIVDEAPPAWAIEALRSLDLNPPKVKPIINLITSKEEWEAKVQTKHWPSLIIAEYETSWNSAAEILHLLSLQPTVTFVALLSDKPTDDEIAELFHRGLDVYMRKTPPRPRLLKARLKRVLSRPPLLMQERLNLGSRVKDITTKAQSVNEIAEKTLPLLAKFLRSEWAAILFREKGSPRWLNVFPPESKVSPEDAFQAITIAREARESFRFNAEQLPPEASDFFIKRGIRIFNTHRLFERPDAEEWIIFGWRGITETVRERTQLTSELLQWIGSASQRAYAENLERARRKEMEALLGLMFRLNRALTEEEVAEGVLDGLKSLVPYDHASVWLWSASPRSPKLEIVGARGYSATKEAIQQEAHSRKPPIEEWATVQILNNTHRPLILEDVTLFPEWKSLSVTKNVRSWAGIPIVFDEEVIGLVFMDSFTPNAFTGSILSSTQWITTAAGIAFHNARLFHEQQKWRERSSTLRWMALQMVSTLDPQEVLRQLVSETLALTGAEDVHIFFHNGKKLVFVAGEHRDRRLERPYWEPRPEGITNLAAKRRQPIIVPDARDHPLYADSPWYGAIVSIPLIVRRRLLGVLNVAWSAPREFTDDDIDLLRNLADYAAIALENARLVASLEKQVRDLTTLTAFGERLRSMFPNSGMAQAVVEQAVSLANANVGVICQDTKDGLLIRGARGWPKKLVGQYIPKTRNVCGDTVTHGRIRTFYHLPYRDLFPPAAISEALGDLKRAIAFPLKPGSGHQAAGCLLVGWLNEEGPVPEETVNVLALLADMVSNALERSRAQQELEAAFLQTVTALSRALDERDHYHGDHSERLGRWSALVARELKCSEEEIATIKKAALLHDIGKIGIPDKILRKPGPLTEKEWEIIKQHPTIGARILRPLERLRPVAKIVEAHHERWDGSGYPYGLKGEEIPLGARIIAVVDSYGAMVDQRVYRSAIPKEKAIAEIARGAGTLYDPRVVQAFLKVVDEFD